LAGIAPDDPAQAPDQQQPDQSQGIAPDQSQGPDEVGDEEGLSPNVSPEEQKQYEDFVLACMALIYTKAPAQSGDQGQQDDQGQGGDQQQAAQQPDQGGAQVRPGILKLLDNDPSDLRGILKADELKQFSPLVAIAATTVIVVIEVQKLGKGTPDQPADDIVMHGFAAIIEELAQIWMTRNKQQLSEDDVHKALSMGGDIYREVAADAGLLDENALKDQFSMLVKADKEGKLADISPDLAGINKAAEINMTQGDDAGDQEEQSEPVDNAQEEDQEK
jgi:hypothetical protein